MAYQIVDANGPDANIGDDLAEALKTECARLRIDIGPHGEVAHQALASVLEKRRRRPCDGQLQQASAVGPPVIASVPAEKSAIEAGSDPSAEERRAWNTLHEELRVQLESEGAEDIDLQRYPAMPEAVRAQMKVAVGIRALARRASAAHEAIDKHAHRLNLFPELLSKGGSGPSVETAA